MDLEQLAPLNRFDGYVPCRAETGGSLSISRPRPRRVRSRRREAWRRRARSKDRSWAYLRHEFHVGASRGSVCGSPRLTENREKPEVSCEYCERMRRVGAPEHQWATVSSTTHVQSAMRTALPGEPPMCRQSSACNSGSRYLRAACALLRAVAQPLPGPVSSARPCASLRLRACAIGITHPRSWFAAIAPHTHVSARCSRQPRYIRSARMFVCP